MRFFGILNMWRGWQKAFVQIAQRGIWSGWKPRKYWEFPHCMWGCIARLSCLPPGKTVPSLYVRVYRNRNEKNNSEISSLPVCEGVSRIWNIIKEWKPFPHCMWGCIVHILYQEKPRRVPSLYVRVYRVDIGFRSDIIGSLIICEGVSKSGLAVYIVSRFPHYMWGCIGWLLHRWYWPMVPSLYVRVYRCQKWAV